MGLRSLSIKDVAKVSLVIVIIISLVSNPIFAPRASAFELEEVKNGGFTYNFDYWVYTQDGGSGGDGSITHLGSGGESGGYVNLRVWYSQSTSWANAQISQSVDLTGVSTLTYYIFCDFASLNRGQNRFIVLIDGSQIYNTLTPEAFTSWTKQTIDVSGYTGSHTITFRVQTQNGGEVSMNIDTVSAIGSYTNPTINWISSDVNEGTAPLTVAFYSDVIDGFPTPTWYIWTWGDGTTSGMTSDPSHTFTTPGEYTVKLEVYNSKTQGYYPHETISIKVNEPPPSSVEFDAARYLSTDTARVTTYIDTYEPDEKTYTLRLYEFEEDILGSLKGTWPIGSKNATTQINVSAYPPGNYIVYLYESEAGVGNVLAFATAEFSYTTGYYGKTYNAESEELLDDVLISFVQSGTSKSATSNISGDYSVLGLVTNAEVTISASKDGYTHKAVKHTPVKQILYPLNIYLLPETPSYTGTSIGGVVTDVNTGVALSGATVTLTGTNSASTTTSAYGYYQFNDLEPGLVTIGVTANGYKPSTPIDVTLTEDTFVRQDITLTPLSQDTPSSGGYGYLPHNVKFTVLSAFGGPIAGATVLATPIESSGPWSWLEDLLGVPHSTDIQNTALSGTTGTDGGVTFAMIESVKYRIDVDDAARGISASITIYPKEDETIIYLWPAESRPLSENVIYDLTAIPVDSDTTRLSLVYRDRLSSTQNLIFYVKTESGDPIHNETRIKESNITISYDLTNDPGNIYIFGFEALHSTHGTIQEDQFIRFEKDRPMIDFAPWIPIWIYNWIAIALIVSIAGIFGFMNQKFGVVVVPIFALFFTYVRWLSTPILLTLCALIIGVLLYLRYTEGETGA